MTTAKKIAVLCLLADRFNQEDITWQLGGSCLLYLHQYVEEFTDLDIVIALEDANKVTSILQTLGEPMPKETSSTMHSAYFAGYLVQGVMVDIMADVTIV